MVNWKERMGASITPPYISVYLREKVKSLPACPGVYMMKDSNGYIIYVGKSKCIKSRVQSYFYQSQSHSSKVERLVRHIKDIDHMVTDTEFEAFMLECQLIKQFQPFYNKQMKTPSAYVYLVLRTEKITDPFVITNHLNEGDRIFFGPYSSKNMVKRQIECIKDYYKLNCNQSSTSYGTPCLNYSIGLCCGICFQPSAIRDYKQWKDLFIAFLKGEDRQMIMNLEKEMNEASIQFDFERAAKGRDCIHALQSLAKKERIIEFATKNKALIVVEPLDQQHIKVFLLHRNRIIFSKTQEYDRLSIKELFQSWIKRVRDMDFSNEPLKVGKEEMDEAQIIYRYVKHNKHIMVLNKDSESDEEIDRAMDKFMKEWKGTGECF